MSSKEKAISNVGTGCEYQHQQARFLPVKVDSTEADSESSLIPGIHFEDSWYKMDNLETGGTRGMAVIINTHEIPCMGIRSETEEEFMMISKAFGGILRFELKRYDNVSLEKMRRAFADLASVDHSQSDCFVCFVYSHGKDDVIVCSDGETVRAQDIFCAFTESACPSLAGKPKLFFFEVTHGGHENQAYPKPCSLHPDSSSVTTTHRTPADLFIFYNRTQGNDSRRDRCCGSLFIQTLCQVLERYYCTRNFEAMMQTVMLLLAGRNVSPLPVMYSTFTKNLRFLPQEAPKALETSASFIAHEATKDSPEQDALSAQEISSLEATTTECVQQHSLICSRDTKVSSERQEQSVSRQAFEGYKGQQREAGTVSMETGSLTTGTKMSDHVYSAVKETKRKKERTMRKKAQKGSSLATGTKMSDHIISAAKGRGSAVYSVGKVAAASGRSVVAASLPYLRITGKKTTTYSSFASEGTDQLGSAACPVVVRPHKDANNFELRDENLLLLLTNSDVADLPVVVLSVAGGFRLGKSFLLGFCIRYLKHLEMSSDRSDWMDEENIPLTGFSWKYGSERETTGIQLWGKVFKIMTRQHGLVAVVLMDTECSFDNRFTMEGNVTVFSLSMLLSSVQVYNLTKQITQSDLEHLKLFTEYASMARSAGGRDKEVFQKLLFLIRDWQYPGEKSFGLEGGEALLQPFLQRDPTLQNEVSKLRENIRNSFSEVKCFLMPRPGDAVENTEFDGTLRDISRDFKNQLKNLVSCLLSPERLAPKKINGRIVKCEELLPMFQAYFTVFNKKELPTPMSVFNATAFVHNTRINDEIVKKYETSMEWIALGNCHSESDTDIDEQHQKVMKECLSQFEKEQKMGNHDRQLREQLVKELNRSYDKCKWSRKMIREYKRIVEELQETHRRYEEKILQVTEEESSKRDENNEAMAKTHNLDPEKMKNAMQHPSTVGFRGAAMDLISHLPFLGPLLCGLVKLFKGEGENLAGKSLRRRLTLGVTTPYSM